MRVTSPIPFGTSLDNVVSFIHFQDHHLRANIYPSTVSLIQPSQATKLPISHECSSEPDSVLLIDFDLRVRITCIPGSLLRHLRSKGIKNPDKQLTIDYRSPPLLSRPAQLPILVARLYYVVCQSIHARSEHSEQWKAGRPNWARISSLSDLDRLITTDSRNIKVREAFFIYKSCYVLT